MNELASKTLMAVLPLTTLTCSLELTILLGLITSRRARGRFAVVESAEAMTGGRSHFMARGVQKRRRLKSRTAESMNLFFLSAGLGS